MEKHTEIVPRRLFDLPLDFATGTGNSYSSMGVSLKFWPVVFTALRWIILAALLTGWP